MTMLRRTAVLSMSLAAGLSSPALGQDQKAPESYKSGTVLVVEHASLSKLFSDPKDKAFGDALAMVPSRVRELPHQVPDMPPEAAGLINMALNALARPGRLAVMYDGDNPSGGAFGYGVIASVLAEGEDDANQMHGRIMGLMAQNKGGPRPMKSKRFQGMMDIQTPVALLSFGPRKAADGWRYEIVFGTANQPDAVSAALPKAVDGLEPVLSARMDFAGLGPVMEMAKSFAAQNPEAAEGIQKLADAGVGGPDSAKVSFVMGHTKSEAVAITTIEGAKQLADTWGLGTTPLTRQDLAAIPSDAGSMYISRGGDGPIFDLSALSAQGPQVGQILDQFQEHTGVDLQKDILNSLGSTTALYTSDTTGGSGLGSAVAMVSLRDRAALWAALGKLTAQANMHADKIPLGPGFVRLVAHKDGGTDLLTLRFNGIPVPLELTVALTDKWLIAAPTPQAALAASRQASGKGDDGLPSNKTFAAALPDGKQYTSVSFTDTARNLAGGYTVLTMIGSALANGVRSPTDVGREPGLIVPLFNDLKKGVRPSIGYSYWRGNDLISETHTDRSTLVGMAGAGGAMATILPLLVIPAAIGAAQQNRLGMVFEPATGYATIVARIARMSMPPGTADHAMWTLASNPGAERVLWSAWADTLPMLGR